MSVPGTSYLSRTSLTESRPTQRLGKKVCTKVYMQVAVEYHNSKRTYWRHTMSIKEPQSLTQLGESLAKAARKLRSQQPKTGRRTQEEVKADAKKSHQQAMALAM